MGKSWLFIEGSIEIDVHEDKFTNEFCEWLESKGWSFTGFTEPIKDEDEDNNNDNDE